MLWGGSHASGARGTLGGSCSAAARPRLAASPCAAARVLAVAAKKAGMMRILLECRA